MAFHTGINLGFGRIGPFIEQTYYPHDHARRAKAALGSVRVEKGLLHRVQAALLRQSLDGQNFLAIDCPHRSDTGMGALACDQNSAGAAAPVAAAGFGASQAEVFAQNFEERPVRIRSDGPGLAVHSE
jgi:hypothetical protein